tara:strand:- start:146 stop:1006 length:861 start_codon:yes stop_codon:yes gene_type:complete
MKLIDDKGRLFGKINVIDLLVILFLLGLTPIFYYGYKITTFNVEAPPQLLQGTVLKEFEVKFKNIPKKFLPMIKEGDKQYDETKGMIAEIAKIMKKEPSSVIMSYGKESIAEKIVKLDDYYDLTVKMNLLVLPLNGKLNFNNTSLKFNTKYTFSLNKYMVEGFLLSPEIKVKSRIITLKIKGIDPELANVIKEGDKGNIGTGRGEIIRVISINKAEIFSILKDEFIMLKSPKQKDVVLQIKVHYDKAYLGDRQGLKINDTAKFSNNIYSFSGKVSAFSLVSPKLTE